MAELIFQVAAKAPSYNYKSDHVTLLVKTDRWLLLVLKILAPSCDPQGPENSAMPTAPTSFISYDTLSLGAQSSLTADLEGQGADKETKVHQRS